jgi:hypothetical protein
VRRGTGTLCSCAPWAGLVVWIPAASRRRSAGAADEELAGGRRVGRPCGRTDVVRGRWPACPGVSWQETAEAWAIGVGLAELAAQ